MRRMFMGLASAALLWGGVAGVVGPVAAGAWPGCPNDHPEGPCHWCPGDPPVQTGNLRGDPVRWDANVCHTYWYVGGGGNAAPPAPTVNGALLRPRDAPKLSYRDAPLSRSSRFTGLPVYLAEPYSGVPLAVRSSGRHTVAIILSASVWRLAVHSGNR